jgi:hypothetical protein
VQFVTLSRTSRRRLHAWILIFRLCQPRLLALHRWHLLSPDCEASLALALLLASVAQRLLGSTLRRELLGLGTLRAAASGTSSASVHVVTRSYLINTLAVTALATSILCKEASEVQDNARSGSQGSVLCKCLKSIRPFGGVIFPVLHFSVRRTQRGPLRTRCLTSSRAICAVQR